MFFRLASKSLFSRKGSVLLTILAMTVSIVVMLGVEHMRHQAKANFASSVSGIDLIIGSRTSKLNLLLYSVFRMGSPTNNISWQSYQELKNHKAVHWSIPISLGDSHKGYRVLGTTQSYFKHFSYGQKQPLEFANGHEFNSVFDVVLGAKVAQKLGYQVGDNITLSHGIGSTSFSEHDNAPFTIVGILKPTGTPVDQTVHVSLQGIEAVHLSPSQFAQYQQAEQQHSVKLFEALTPNSVTAVMVGLKSRMMVFNLQRAINTNNDEPLTAILPGVALSELWQSMGIMENTLRVISILVLISALFGLSAMLLSSIRERRQEIKLLRMIGATPMFIYWFVELEAMLITLISIAFAYALLSLTLVFSQDYLISEYGLSIDLNIISQNNMQALAIILVFALIAAIPPALSAFNNAKKY